MTDTAEHRPRTQHTAPADIEHEDQERSVAVACPRCWCDYLVTVAEIQSGEWRRRCPVCQDGGDVSAKG